MATAMVSAAFSVVGKALSPLTGSLLKQWAASVELGSNVQALELELLSVKAILEHALGKDIDNSGLKELLVMLQGLGYDAEDVLDELDYFRIQDELDGTFDAADEHANGGVHNLAFHVQHTGKAVGKRIGLSSCFPIGAKREVRSNDDTISSPLQHTNQQASREKLASRSMRNTIVHAVGKCFPSSSLAPPARECLKPVGSTKKAEVVETNYYESTQTVLISSFFEETCMHNSWQQKQTNDPPKLSFNRVDASTRMQSIVEKLRLVRKNVSDIILTLGPNWNAAPNIAHSRLITTSENIEPKLYGRDHIMSSIINDITQGKHSADEVVRVIPIVGPGGIGKTTLAQHIYHSREVQEHFDVKVWKCVSLNFNANKLIEEIEKHIPKVDGESNTDTSGELIGKRLKNKRFLLVLDDVWDCSNEDEWMRLLVPFKKSQVQGNIIMVTTRFQAQSQIMIKKIDHQICLKGLKHEEFKDLFLEIVFGNDQSVLKDHEYLLETGDKIVERLKGSPLAAKTVGGLLKNKPDLCHWTGVLERKEWEQRKEEYDIMPALKLSYDYLPSQLQQCFSYCALFPQDYKFEREELINFWIGLDVLHSSQGDYRRVEDIGLSHLTELVNHGFFEKNRGEKGNTCYVLHDLLHELAQKVSSHECLSINSCNKVRSLPIPPLIRHLSITIDDTSIEDRLSLKNCVEDFKTLDKRLMVEKLRTLMLFGEHHGCFVKAFGDLFREANALRVVFLSKASYDVEDLLHNFSYLLHLRYLRIQSSSLVRIRFPKKLSRFYHMMVLDAKHCDIAELPRDMSNLVKLRHFLVQHDETHSRIVDVGKLKSLQELRRFKLKNEYRQFELRQLGHLVELCGSLYIDNLENVQAKEEADEANLMQKTRLHELILCWNSGRSADDSALEEHVLERLKPSSNLLKLSIVGHAGATCPSWLGKDVSVKSLESLSLDGVAWKTFPPVGEVWLENVPHEEISGGIPNKRFGNLRRLNFENLPSLKKWAVHAPCQLFPFLEVLVIRGCSNLVELSFSHSACCQQEKVAYASLFPRLLQLVIRNCPQLLSFPPVPWTEAPCSIEIEGTGSSCLHKLVYAKNSKSEYCLTIEGKDTPDRTFLDLLVFHNLTRLKELRMLSCQPMALHHLQMLPSLRTLRMSCLSTAFPFAECDSHVKYQFPVEFLTIDGWTASGKELTRLLTHFLKLSELNLWSCEKITELSVMGQLATATSRPSSLANRVGATLLSHLQLLFCKITGLSVMGRQQTLATLGPSSPATDRENEEIVASEAGLLLLPPQLQELGIVNCPELRLLNPLEDTKENGRTGQGRGLQGLSSLQRLSITNCPKLLSSYSSSSFSCFPFPNSLEYLRLEGMVGMETLEPLSNLSSLTSLSTTGCVLLRGEGLLSLVAQGCLARLYVAGTPVLYFDPEPSWVQEQEHQSHSSKLQELSIDDVAAATATRKCSFLLSSLTTLNFFEDQSLQRFTKEQEALLFVSSLEEISFMLCSRLQTLPERLHSLPNLKRLYIWECKALRELHGFPCSLQELVITGCPEIKSLPSLPSSLQKLVIKSCRRIDRLPKVDELPSSLREVDVRDSRSEELRRHCRELIGIIPIIRA